jgi:SAM-dependent methyltransferase
LQLPARRRKLFHTVSSSDPTRPAATPAGYVLGHSEAELRRLTFQADLIEPITRELLVDAGIGEGMRVLDVGTGRGDVAFLVAELVGETGSVLGVDKASAAIAAARERLAERSQPNVSFEEGDPAELSFATSFDAIVGRYVLQFVPEPGELLRRLVAHLRPRGIVAFHEIDWSGRRSFPPVALWDRCCTLVTSTIAAGGADLESGVRLPSIFAAAGLPPPSIGMTTSVGAGANSAGVVQRMANLILSLLPTMEERGFVEPGELDPETLTQRLVEEVGASESFLAAGSEVTAWSRLESTFGSEALRSS